MQCYQEAHKLYRQLHKVIFRTLCTKINDCWSILEKLGIPWNKSTVTAFKEWCGTSSLLRLQEEYCLREAASLKEWCGRRGEGACPCRRGTRQAGSWNSQSTSYNWSDTILETRTICLHWWWPSCADHDMRTRTAMPITIKDARI